MIGHLDAAATFQPNTFFTNCIIIIVLIISIVLIIITIMSPSSASDHGRLHQHHYHLHRHQHHNHHATHEVVKVNRVKVQLVFRPRKPQHFY